MLRRSSTELYIKKAYLQAKVSDVLVIRLGSTDLPWAPFAEDIYGYRYVENTLIDHVTLAIGGYTGKLGKETQGATTFHTANHFNALAAYTTKQYRFGVKYFSAENWNNVTTAASDSADGYSVFGSYAFNDKLGAFARYDWVKPNKDTAPAKKDNYFNVGLTYSPAKIVDLSLVYKRDQVERGLLAASNGTIGGVNKGTYDEVGLFGQFRF